jgi:hypothetical protein
MKFLPGATNDMHFAQKKGIQTQADRAGARLVFLFHQAEARRR